MKIRINHLDYRLNALRAKGRMKKGELNRTEAAYAQCKSVATQYPFALFVVYPRSKRDGGGFDVFAYPGK